RIEELLNLLDLILFARSRKPAVVPFSERPDQFRAATTELVRTDEKVLPLQRHDHPWPIGGVSPQGLVEQSRQGSVLSRHLLREMTGVQPELRDQEWIDRTRRERPLRMTPEPAEILMHEHRPARHPVKRNPAILADQTLANRIDVARPLRTLENP